MDSRREILRVSLLKSAIFRLFPVGTEDGTKSASILLMPEEVPILLVDDDPSIRKLCHRMLSRMNIPVVECTRGDEAVNAINGPDPFRAVLLDLNLPDASGIDLFHQFKTQRPDLRVILFTGSSPVLKEEGLVFLKKPFTKATLVTALTEAGVLTDAAAE